jgi:carboxymethylenebutenolidase
VRFCLSVLALSLLGGCAAKPVAPEPGDSMQVVEYGAGKEAARGLLYRPAGVGPFPGLVVVHGDYGLNEAVKEKARRLADRGYAVLAADLYRGEVVTELLDAHIMDRGLAEDQVLANLKAAADFLAGHPDVRADGLGIVGWDSGGGYALDAALHDPRLRAVVTCYGRLTTDPELLASLQGPVLGLFAGKDEGISPETVEQFRAALGKAGKRLGGIHVYADCPHGFMDALESAPTEPAVRAARADAWERIEQFLAAELKR